MTDSTLTVEEQMHRRARKVVGGGALLLDKRDPGWFRKIKTGQLNIGSFCGCILGQRFEDYQDGKNLLGLDEDAATRYGFNASVDDINRYGLPMYGALRESWLAQISHRLAFDDVPEKVEVVLDDAGIPRLAHSQ